jgi:hypothetical protein
LAALRFDRLWIVRCVDDLQNKTGLSVKNRGSMVRSFTVTQTVDSDSDTDGSRGESQDESGSDFEQDDTATETHEIDEAELIQGFIMVPRYIANVIGYGHISQIRHAIASSIEDYDESDAIPLRVVAACHRSNATFKPDCPDLATLIIKVCGQVTADTGAAEDTVIPVAIAVVLGGKAIPPSSQVESYLNEFRTTKQLPTHEEWQDVAPQLSRADYQDIVNSTDPQRLLDYAMTMGLVGEPPTERTRIRHIDLKSGDPRCIPTLRVTLSDLIERKIVDEVFTAQRPRRGPPSSPRSQRRTLHADGIDFLERRRRSDTTE